MNVCNQNKIKRKISNVHEKDNMALSLLQVDLRIGMLIKF